jgi:regulator of replication initiation timing
MVKQAAATAVARTVDLDVIDRLEEKLKLLLASLAKLREEQARTTEDNERLNQELTMLRARLAEAEAVHAELVTLRDERDVIRARVSDMLQQLEAI